ncbi:hemicentin-2-like [Ornithodoros turicata]|uniref:hemicentin-2-like n=1 Tax=Ornithodoros turicata TaxID=34597 RepID=UPI00313884E7
MASEGETLSRRSHGANFPSNWNRLTSNFESAFTYSNSVAPPTSKLTATGELTVLLTESATADLPCDLGSREDRAVKAWWHRGDDPTVALYTLEAPSGRKGTINLAQAHHIVGPSLEGRAHFSVVRSPALLSILRLKYEDRGIYVCNVQYEHSSSRSYGIELNIIVPPSVPLIMDENMTEVHGTVGPYNEGALLILHCHVTGGKPEPRVSWQHGSEHLHRVYHQTEDGVKKATLHVRTLRREFLGAAFTCEAANNNITQPSKATVVIDMNLKPQHAVIRGKQDFLSADFPTEVECEAEGSLPAAIISWWLGRTHIDPSQAHVRILSGGNITSSLLRFVPRDVNNGQQLRCLAHNPRMTGHDKVQDTWTLQVHYKPRPHLRWGHHMNSSGIIQGQDVYLDCDVDANPAFTDLSWRFNGQDLASSELRANGARLLLSNQSLALRGVQRHNAGHYSCMATNAEGTEESNRIFLRVRHLPVCAPGQQTVYSASRHEHIRVTCTVLADPADNVTFHWAFNGSYGRRRDLSSSLHSVVRSSRGREDHGGLHSASPSTMSVLRYQPRNRTEFGTLSCTARNAIGLMIRPCVFHVVLAGPPQALRSCTVSEQTDSSFRVECRPPPGPPETDLRFMLEVQEQEGQRLAANLTSPVPAFWVRDLPPGIQCTLLLYAVNGRGRSEPLLLTTHTLINTAEGYYEPGNAWVFPSRTVLFVLIAASLLLLLLPFAIVLALKYRSKASDEQDEKEIKQDKHSWIQLSQGVELKHEPSIFPEQAFTTQMTSFQSPASTKTVVSSPSSIALASAGQDSCPQCVC